MSTHVLSAPATLSASQTHFNLTRAKAAIGRWIVRVGEHRARKEVERLARHFEVINPTLSAELYAALEADRT